MQHIERPCILQLRPDVAKQTKTNKMYGFDSEIPETENIPKIVSCLFTAFLEWGGDLVIFKVQLKDHLL